MSKDKNERRHRRTAGSLEAIQTMAGANFDAAPSLAEAMMSTPRLEFVEGKTAGTPDMKNPRRAVWLADGDFVVCVVTEGADLERSAAAMKHAAHATQVLPELLAALDDVLAWWNSLPLDSKPNIPNHEAIHAAVLAARAAIAKARGN